MSDTPESRVARYKEERRKQLAAQFSSLSATKTSSTKDASSSSTEGPRTTRASRLRAAAVLEGGSSASPPKKLEQKKDRKPVSPNILVEDKSEKDKSSKRKSNLNRSLNCEEVPSSDCSDDQKSRRRRRRFFPQEVLQQPITAAAASNDEQQKTDTSLTASFTISPQPSPITASSPSNTNTNKKSELSVHMENARRGITPPTSSPKSTRNNSSRRVFTSSPKDRNAKNSSSDIDQDISHKDKNAPSRLANKENIKRKNEDTKDKHTNKMSTVDQTEQKFRNPSMSKRIEEITALTKETRAGVEKLANRESPRRDIEPSKKCTMSKSKPLNTDLILNIDKPLKKKTETRNDSRVSILKKKSVDETAVPEVIPFTCNQPLLPVSILKRKISQDESKSGAKTSSTHTPPVTFSQNVIEPTTSKHKQGILKKRRSLDESQVMRHRSCSPDVANSKHDSKSILKNQRRSSLEELRQTQSPDAHIQGILKRRLSRNEDDNDQSLNSPQGILKRKSGASSAGSITATPHVSIATACILAAAGGAEMILESNDSVKPILKKKSFSEESSHLDSVGSDTLKPILKKKSSTDTDESEDKPKRPILKHPRNSSETRDSEDSETPMSVFKSNHQSLNDSGSECEVRPILKQSNSQREESPRPRLSFCSDDENDNRKAQTDNSTKCRHKIYVKSNTICTSLRRNSLTREPEEDRNLIKPRPMSVFDIVKSFEKQTGVTPKKLIIKRNDRRRSTQPVTFTELEASKNLLKKNQPDLNLSKTPEEIDHLRNSFYSSLELNTSIEDDYKLTSPTLSPSPFTSTNLDNYSSKMASDSAFHSLGDDLDETEDSEIKCVKVSSGIQKYKNRKTSIDRTNASRFSTQPVTLDEVQEAARLRSETDENNSEAICEDEADPSKLSLSERVKLFNKKIAEEHLTPKRSVPKTRHTRFQTQPVTFDEVEKAKSVDPINSENSTIDDDDTSLKRSALKSKLESILKGPPPSFKAPVRSVLKQQEGKRDSGDAPRSILKVEEHSCKEGVSSDSSNSEDEGFLQNRECANFDNFSEVHDVSSTSESANGAIKADKNTYLGQSASDETTDESSGGREVRSIIGREASARRRHKDKFNPEALLPKSKSQANVGDDPSELYPKRRSVSVATMRPTIDELKSKLQQSGDNDWKKRVDKLNNASEELNLLTVKNRYNDELTEKSSILSTRKDELDAASRNWKNRIETNDAANFTVAARMQNLLPEISINIPTPDKGKRAPRAKRFKGREGENKDTSSTPVSPDLDTNLQFKRSVSVPSATNGDDSSSSSESSLKSSGRKVAVIRPDDFTFTNFFKPLEVKEQETKIDVSVEDFDVVTRDTQKLHIQKRKVQVQRKYGGSRNPVKTLAARTDLKYEYTEVITGVAEREKKRLHIEKLAKSSNLAVEALAGLASKEDFTSVALKKSSMANYSLVPFKNLMLLQVKGRRHVQTRLIEPIASNINEGDNFILITPNKLFHYIGLLSNCIEQSRASDIVNHIIHTSDMGCKTEKVIVINYEKDGKTSDSDMFWKLLGAHEDVEIVGAGHPDEDKLYESNIVDTNMIYKYENGELIPVDQYWGKIPKIEMLGSSSIYVFDFGSEMYIWSGKTAPIAEKKHALALAKDLWQEGFNYTECGFCPVNVASVLGARREAENILKSDSRPEWALFAKLTQHRETILFKEKFLDWPDFSRVIKVKDDEGIKTIDATITIQPCDAEDLLKIEYKEPSIEVEGTELGRGREFIDNELHRLSQINTLDITVWRILENGHEKLDETEIGHFNDGDTYIVRWQFRVTVTGRELSGKPSKYKPLGRSRCVYFLWFGENASINEKGVAALLTIELDTENARQIRIIQGSEPPAFLQLFDGKMTIHKGKSIIKRTETKRLYIVRGELEHETVLLEVPCCTKSLRSKSSLILMDSQNNKITVWHGSKSPKNTQKVCKAIADYIAENDSSHYGIGNEVEEVDIVEMNEKHHQFFSEIDGDESMFYSLQENEHSLDATPRLFHFSSVSGDFKATEVICPHRSKEITPLPFLQSDLYSASQPAIFLFDNAYELWLWQGWWPDVDDETELADQRGSGAVRWQAERRASMQTAVNYWNLKHPDSNELPIYTVNAGLEPLSFTNLFPTWEEKKEIAELNIKDGKKPGDATLVHKELLTLTRSIYPLNELLQRPLPEAVDPTHLEDYLSAEDFFELLSMTKNEFEKLPAWKQTAIKKEKGLF